MRTWALLTNALDETHPTPLYLQLSNALADDIRRGRLKPGEALPGTRVFAQRLGVHRSTVIAGYRELVAQGLVVARRGGGTFVAGRTPRAAPAGSRPATTPTYAMRAPLRDVPMALPDPVGPLNLFRAIPDVRLLPAEALARAFRRGLLRHGRTLLGYTDPRGHELLRFELAKLCTHARGLVATTSNVLVTRGSQQALTLLAHALFSPGDVVVVEALGGPLVWSALRHSGAHLEPVRVDAEGLDVDALEALLARRTVRAVYVTPHHQFPMNTELGARRRARLATLARAHRFALIEDDYDHEFHYDGLPPPPIAAHADGANVIYVGSLSKVLAPGLRVGFVVGPTALIENLTRLRAVLDLQGDAAMECAVAELFEDGELLRHVRRMTQRYQRRRDAFAGALAAQLGDALSFHLPAGGMALWARVRDGIDLDAWVRAAEARGVLFRGAAMFDFNGAFQPFVRLGFTAHDEGELADAAERLARALERT